MKVVGIDLSMTSTGLAVIGGDGMGTAFRLERVRSKPDRCLVGVPTLQQRRARIETIRTQVMLSTGIWPVGDPGPDLVVIEAPSFGSASAGMWDRAWLWGSILDGLHPDTPVIEVSPHQVRKYATGSASTSGKTKVTKDMVLAAVIRRYVHAPVDGNDVADALILAAIGARMLGNPIESSLPVANLAALDKLRLPERTALA